MTFEEITSNDLEELRTLGPDDWNDIVPDFEFYIRSPYCHPIKVVEAKRIIGIGSLIIFEHTAWLAHIIVDTSSRGRGIGAIIVNELIQISTVKGIKSCLLIATELGKPIYLRAGFRIVGEYTFLKRDKGWPYFKVSEDVIPFEEKYRHALYKLDRRISGENRENILKEQLPECLIYVKDEKVEGYYMPNLKEGMIFANTVHAGIELMKIKYATIDKAVLPSANFQALAFLKQNGFIETATAPRMAIGPDINWEPTKMYSRIAGSLG